MTEELPPLESLNVSELCEMIRRQFDVTVKRSLPKERLVQILEYGQKPSPDEIASTAYTRKLLQVFFEKNWEFVNSQLPCKGINRGKCTIYPCPEGRHVSCYTSARAEIRRTMNKDAP